MLSLQENVVSEGTSSNIVVANKYVKKRGFV